MKRNAIVTLAVAAALAAPTALSAANNPPTGWLDADTGGQVRGWALDPDSPGAPIDVHFYVDGPAGIGPHEGIVAANLPRADVNQALRVPGDHGFAWLLPQKFRDGYYHKVYAYGIDSSGGPNPALYGAPFGVGPRPNGNQEIRAVAGGSPLIVRTFDLLAGAIGSVEWAGKEFIYNFDPEGFTRGRSLQSAINYDGFGECLNPTEAGARADKGGSVTTSVLQAMSAHGNTLSSRTRMAYWLRRGESPGWCNGKASGGVNAHGISEDILTKRATIGFRHMAHAIEHVTRYTVPEPHSQAQFMLVGHMQPEFSSFRNYDPFTKTLTPLHIPNDGTCKEYADPVIVATPDSRYAMGVYDPLAPRIDDTSSRYAICNNLSGPPGFPTVLWGMVQRRGSTPPADYEYRGFSVVGSLQNVRDTLDQLRDFFQPKGYLDVADCQNIAGWACTRSKAEAGKKIHVDIYADGAGAGAGGRLLERVLADKPREPALMGLCGNSGVGFSVPTPRSLKDGRPHTIHVFGLSDTARNPLLANSGKTIQCEPEPAAGAPGAAEASGRTAAALAAPAAAKPVPDAALLKESAALAGGHSQVSATSIRAGSIGKSEIRAAGTRPSQLKVNAAAPSAIGANAVAALGARASLAAPAVVMPSGFVRFQMQETAGEYGLRPISLKGLQPGRSGPPRNPRSSGRRFRAIR